MVIWKPSFELAKAWKEGGAKAPDSDDIGQVIKALSSGNFHDTVVLANSYEGIVLLTRPLVF